MNLRANLIKNAAANMARGGTRALVALFVPPFLTRSLSPDKFSAWALAMQLGAYVNYLDFSLQTAVARYVARINETGNTSQQNEFLSSALFLMTLAGVLAVTALCGLAVLLPKLYANIAPSIAGELQSTMLIIGLSLSIGLPASVFTGVLVGLHKNEVPAFAIGGCRIGSAVTLVLLSRYTNSLIALAASYSAWNLLSYTIQYGACRSLICDVRLGWRLIKKTLIWDLGKYCLTLSTWSVGMLLVSGLDLVLVGYINFTEVGPYSVANTLVTFVAGLNSAICASLIAPTAVLQARNENRRLGKLVMRATRLTFMTTFLVGLPLVLGGHFILQRWVGNSYAQGGYQVLRILVLAQVIRLIGNPYSVAILGTGQQRLVVVSPLVEGITNLSASLALGLVLGAVGVAWGTLIGSTIGLAWNTLYNIPRTQEIRMTAVEYTSQSILRPAVCLLPLCLGLIPWCTGNQMEPFFKSTCGVAGIVVSVLTCMRLGTVKHSI